MKIAIIFRRLSPYHYARLRALGNFCDLSAIELSSVDETYAWDTVKGSENFTRLTLFNDSDADFKPGREIVPAVYKTLDQARPDAVAIPGWATKGALAALSWCLARKVPSVLMSDSTKWDKRRTWWKEFLKRKLVRLYHSGFAAGQPQVEYLLALGMSESRVFTGYDVVDNAYFWKNAQAAREKARDLRTTLNLPEKYILCVSRFVEKKNLFGLLDAYALYSKSADGSVMRLVILGSGELEAGLRARVSQLGLDNRVRFPGFIQYDNLPVYYALASFFILASVSEQWGLVVNEAMACGLPVLVSSYCGCARDLVAIGKNGYTFDPGNIEEFAGLIQNMAGDDNRLLAMGAKSREIISHWTTETFSNNLISACTKALRTEAAIPSITDKIILRTLLL